MDKFNFDDKLNSLERNYITFKRLLLVSMLGNLVLVFILLATINKEKIILVPQVAPEYKLWIAQTQVSNEYLSVLSRNIVDLMLSITPSNVEAQHQELLKLIASKYQADLKTKLSNISKVITQNNISQNFYIQNIKIIHGKNIVYINGSLNEYIDKTLASTTNQIYKLSFIVGNYSVQLVNFELVNEKDDQLRGLGL
jgi:type IV conjugative transfer system protein TraE